MRFARRLAPTAVAAPMFRILDVKDQNTTRCNKNSIENEPGPTPLTSPALTGREARTRSERLLQRARRRPIGRPALILSWHSDDLSLLTYDTSGSAAATGSYRLWYQGWYQFNTNTMSYHPQSESLPVLTYGQTLPYRQTGRRRYRARLCACARSGLMRSGLPGAVR